jgi:hypothetical protein
MLWLRKTYRNVTRCLRLVDFRAGVALDGQKAQTFFVHVKNNAGTLQHGLFVDYNVTLAPAYADRIIGLIAPGNTYANTPTVGAGTDFVNGGGISANIFVLNTLGQTGNLHFAMAAVEYYDGNVVRPRPIPTFGSRNVNGVTILRPEIRFINDMTGADWTINTTNIPSGKSIGFRFMGALA